MLLFIFFNLLVPFKILALEAYQLTFKALCGSSVIIKINILVGFSLVYLLCCCFI